MCLIINNAIASIVALVSAISSVFIACYTCRQKKIQEENYTLSLFKEQYAVVNPIIVAYNYFKGGVDSYVRGVLLEEINNQYLNKGYAISRLIEDNESSFIALFSKDQYTYKNFVTDYYKVLSSARVMSNYLPTTQSGNDVQTLHSFYYDHKVNNGNEFATITQEELANAFPHAKDYIDDFYNKQSVFEEQYSSFKNELLKEITIKSKQ